MSNPQPICLMGPTGSGKTDLAMALANRFKVRIISVDSAMIYRSMDIGTAKPDLATLDQYPHELIDICDPSESYSVASFCQSAKGLIKAAQDAGEIPLFVGGTMMYFNALMFGYSNLPEQNYNVRARLQAQLEEEGVQALHQSLAHKDSRAAAKIHRNDPQRVIRALEVIELSGKTLTELQKDKIKPVAPNALAIALNCEPRSVLHQRIAKRFDAMWQAGFLEEVKALFERGDLNIDMPAMRAVGYRQVWQHLAGEVSAEDLPNQIIASTRQLAKRQLTWLRGWPDLHWFDSQSETLCDEVIAHLQTTHNTLAEAQ